jgi:hypothetical protein
MDKVEFAKNFIYYQEDWCRFAKDILRINLDPQQEEILRGVQHYKMVSVRSGTARGKDFVAAAAALCFLYLTPEFNDRGDMESSTKIAMTAPTGRQIRNIMIPEIAKMYYKAKFLPGEMMADGIRFQQYKDWFLTGFKAGEDTEAWSGFHAVNTMFIITEASGIAEKIYDAIEGNLQQNSRMLLVFNPNITNGYAALSQKSDRFVKFRLSSLDAPNVLHKKTIFPGQVDYDWVLDKVKSWCTTIHEHDFDEGKGDFRFDYEGEIKAFRPNDLFRVKVLGMFPTIGEDSLIPLEWIEIANQRWQDRMEFFDPESLGAKKIGCDIAGMGRDSTVLVHRYENFVHRIEEFHAGGKAEHMKVAGMIAVNLKLYPENYALIDTIGEGAGVYSRLIELGYKNAISCKFSEGAKGLRDLTGVYEFANMRSYLFWAVRDWLNPFNNTGACLPPHNKLLLEATSIRYSFRSDGKIFIEPKEEIKKRIKSSTDIFDALACSFYPVSENNVDLDSYFY